MNDVIDFPRTVLVGLGVVGRAIFHCHVEAGVSVRLIDRDPLALQAAVGTLRPGGDHRVSALDRLGEGFYAIDVLEKTEPQDGPIIVIESISERLDVKRSFFSLAETVFGDDAILCSNTSTLRIDSIAESMKNPGRMAGMHFFMPVRQRRAVEVVRGKATLASTLERCQNHARRIGKEPLVVVDSPGFIVNRLLSPYLNQAMLLLCRGVSAERLETAAERYGMPISPLELIDHIGTRTMFDAGRVYWQSFPTRIDPSPMLAGMVKRKRLGRHSGGGFYDYVAGVRSESLVDETRQMVDSYACPPVPLIDREVLQRLAIPMWIEAALVCRAGIVDDLEAFNEAMRGGLGYRNDDDSGSWLAFFDGIGSDAIAKSIHRWAGTDKSMTAPDELLELLSRCTPSECLLASLPVNP